MGGRRRRSAVESSVEGEFDGRRLVVSEWSGREREGLQREGREWGDGEWTSGKRPSRNFGNPPAQPVDPLLIFASALRLGRLCPVQVVLPRVPAPSPSLLSALTSACPHAPSNPSPLLLQPHTCFAQLGRNYYHLLSLGCDVTFPALVHSATCSTTVELRCRSLFAS